MRPASPERQPPSPGPATGGAIAADRRPWRTSAAIGVTRALNEVSRRFGRGSGTVIGGRAGLAVDPDLVRRLTAGRTVALVTGTNGKTTTTRLLAAALEGHGPVVSNTTGANMPAGHAAALCAAHGRRATPGAGGPAVLEVDERYLERATTETRAQVVVLLNLSRDQLDRTNEVRMTANRWRRALADGSDGLGGGVVVANADDPLVVWGAGTAPTVRWVAAGLRWRSDAVGCPACAGRITFDPSGDGWACACGFGRPHPDVVLGESGVATWAGGRQRQVAPGLPGQFNRANALLAAVAAEALGVPVDEALDAAAAVRSVAGRFTVTTVAGQPTRLLLAKNPAGWAELLELVADGAGPVVVGINARVADGRDPSWLWDVPFERLRGRTVVATGERFRDLSVRLHYAEVSHQRAPDPVAAVGVAAASGDGGGATVEFIGNYTAFHDLLGHR